VDRTDGIFVFLHVFLVKLQKFTTKEVEPFDHFSALSTVSTETWQRLFKFSSSEIAAPEKIAQAWSRLFHKLQFPLCVL